MGLKSEGGDLTTEDTESTEKVTEEMRIADCQMPTKAFELRGTGAPPVRFLT
jgi:hypothetical protein